MLKKLFVKTFNALLPTTCILCQEVSSRSYALCSSCEAQLPWLYNVCPQCALPFSAYADSKHVVCGRCLRYPPPYDLTIALWHYQQPITRLIAGLKFNKQLKCAELMGKLLAKELIKGSDYCLPDCIIPVPLHPSRLRERGFNQALEIARPVAKQLQIPIDITSCQRVKATLAQSSIPARLRRKNTLNAFQVTADLSARHVAIIDDVVTTGYTIKELAKQLKRAGVAKIDIWCLARTTGYCDTEV